MGGHLYMWLAPLLAPVLTVGKLCLVAVMVQGAPCVFSLHSPPALATSDLFVPLWNVSPDFSFPGCVQWCPFFQNLHSEPPQCTDWPLRSNGHYHQTCLVHMLRFKGLKDVTCMSWFGDDWDCSVGSPPEAMITWVAWYLLAMQCNK